MRFLVFEIYSLLVIIMFKFTRFFPCVLGHFISSKVMFISKDAQCYDRSYCIHKFFFLRFLVFELLSILYFTVVNSDLDFYRGREIA